MGFKKKPSGRSVGAVAHSRCIDMCMCIDMCVNMCVGMRLDMYAVADGPVEA